MQHSAELDAQMKTRKPHVLTEGKAWTTGRLLWDQARRSGELMPVVFSAAEDDSGLIYWATIHKIEIAEDRKRAAPTRSSERSPQRGQSHPYV